MVNQGKLTEKQANKLKAPLEIVTLRTTFATRGRGCFWTL